MNENYARGYRPGGIIRDYPGHFDGAQQCVDQGAKACGQMASPFIEKEQMTRPASLGGLVNDRSPLDAALTQLDTGLDAAMATIERLERHLYPVLRPETVAGAGLSGANEAKLTNSAVVMTLQAYNDRLRAVVSRIDAIAARVEC